MAKTTRYFNRDTLIAEHLKGKHDEKTHGSGIRMKSGTDKDVQGALSAVPSFHKRAVKQKNVSALEVGSVKTMSGGFQFGEHAWEYKDRQYSHSMTVATHSSRVDVKEGFKTTRRSSEDIRRTTHHEFGHGLDFSNPSMNKRGFGSAVKEMQQGKVWNRGKMKGFDYVNDVWKRDKEEGKKEFFAESYSMFLNDKAALKREAPKMFKYMDEVIFNAKTFK